MDKLAAAADRTVDRLGMDRRLRDHRLDVAPAYPPRRGTYQGHIRSLGVLANQAGGRWSWMAPTGEPLGRELFGVDELADRGDLSSKLVVGGDFARDLVAGVQDGRMIATAELGADPQ